MSSTNDTICAQSTVPGRAGIAVIRLSGPEAQEIAGNCCSRLLSPRKLGLCSFLDSLGNVIDQGMAAYIPGPNSFTGEDIVELYPHGNPYIVSTLLNRLCQLGARMARAGEFSERAFLANKQDLTQLEATADLIAANSERAAKNALQSMRGEFGRYIETLIEGLLAIRVHLEATLDFPDEEIETTDFQQLTENVLSLIKELDYSIDNANNGIKVQSGISVVILGQPNVGKSSLLNALAGTEQAIVTDIPGTTRDIVEVHLEIEGLEFIVKDTAGLHDSDDPVEQLGMDRARREASNADIVVIMVDHPDQVFECTVAAENQLVVVNKIDQSAWSSGVRDEKIFISALTGDGLAVFRNVLVQTVGNDLSNDERPTTARARHLDCLVKCRENLRNAANLLENTQALELAAEELLGAQHALQEITGRISADELLGKIFSEFCIGK